ncbi:hypothetical protein [Nocardioides donggukensis]|uniref:Uncharacterized protein n=1 Tax=Nocardioides donggukensis TaxID=2774019 RepID=A0A927Q1I3_9ACTN|nr:hypothetical protein [Nocardioides donggukensis]MBD8869474.1 hypothetical protein [Nocardioides donggukensis]
MTVHICRDCGDEVPGGEAVLRSMSFRQVAYCRGCWNANHGSPVPAQRVSQEDAWDRNRQDA